MSPAEEGLVDLDLHGVVGVRLLGADPGDVAAVRRQLGLPTTRLTREPDVVVRFVDEVPAVGLDHVGLGETAFDRERFVLTSAKGGAPTRVVFPFDRVGERPEIVCPHGIPAVPHLIAVMNLTALAKGVLPLHASAFTIGEHGVLVTGWAKSGKTEALLGAAARGAQYVGDEWVYLLRDGTMLGLPEPIRLWDWHLRQLDELRTSRSRGERARLRLWSTAAGTARGLGRTSSSSRRLAWKAEPVLKRQAYVQVPPEEIFGPTRVVLRGHLDAVVLVLSSSEPEIVTTPAGPGEVARRMAASLESERAPFMSHYTQFRYAFPSRSSDLVETAGMLERRLLRDLFDARPAVTVRHPYPVDIAAFGDAVLAAALAVQPGQLDIAVDGARR